MAYRLNRNLEASLIDFLREELLSDGWSGISVEKSVKQANIKPPLILVQSTDTDTQKREIGSGVYIKYPTVTIRIFAKNDGQRLDLADWLLEKLEETINYYTYVVTNGVISSKDLAGQIVVRRIVRNEKELSNTDPSVLEEEDRYRHNLTFSCFIGEV